VRAQRHRGEGSTSDTASPERATIEAWHRHHPLTEDAQLSGSHAFAGHPNAIELPERFSYLDQDLEMLTE
jgi:hypothetical protein